MTETLRGIFAIAATPFDDMGTLLWDDFCGQSDWMVRCGAHGFVWPVMASEYTVISFHERVQGIKLAVDTVAGRIPVVIGVADTSKAGAVALAEEAGTAGADAIIAMPPWATKLGSHDLVRDYYRELGEASGLPIVVQNVGAPLGSSLPGSFVVELCREIPLVQYLKEEKAPMGRSLSEVISFNEPAVKGVFSGGWCRWLVSDHMRGVSGSMPGSHMADVDARMWDLLEEGRVEEARPILDARVVLENAIAAMPHFAGKEVLKRRGVISCSSSRGFGPKALDAVESSEMDYALGLLEPYFVA